VAARARELGVELLAVGTDRYGLTPLEVSEVADRIGPIEPGTAVLVKASRAFGLERVAAVLAPA
jgi:hypothetical protein